MEYASFINPEILLDNKISKFNNNENRPQISYEVDHHSDSQLLKENEEINIKKKLNRKIQKVF